VCLLGKEEVPSSNLGIGLNLKVKFYIPYYCIPLFQQSDFFIRKGITIS
jgi:hypothetical protein